jgi:hypothetical protein
MADSGLCSVEQLKQRITEIGSLLGNKQRILGDENANFTTRDVFGDWTASGLPTIPQKRFVDN